jgi:hypothetical protein
VGIFATIFGTKQTPAPPAAETATKKPAPRLPEPQRVVATSGTPLPRQNRVGTPPTPQPVASAAALQMPQPVLPRSITQRLRQVPALPAPRSHETSGRFPEAGVAAGDVILTLADILPQIPPGMLDLSASVDLTRTLSFPLAEISAALARGRPAVSLASVAVQCPEIFNDPEAIDGNEMLRLPLQKLLVEVGRLRRSTQGAISQALPPVRRIEAPREINRPSEIPASEAGPRLDSWLRSDNTDETGDVRASVLPEPVPIWPSESFESPDVFQRDSDSTFAAETVEIIPANADATETLSVTTPEIDFVSISASEAVVLTSTESVEVPLVETVDLIDFVLKEASIRDDSSFVIESQAADQQPQPEILASEAVSSAFPDLVQSESVAPSLLPALEFLPPVADETVLADPETDSIGKSIVFVEPSDVVLETDSKPVVASVAEPPVVHVTDVLAEAEPSPLPPPRVEGPKSESGPAVPKFPLRPPRSSTKPTGVDVNGCHKPLPPPSPLFLPGVSKTKADAPVRKIVSVPALFGANPLDRYFSTKRQPPVNWGAAGTLLGISGEVTVSRIADAIALLPGVSGCLLMASPYLMVSGEWPASMGVDNSIAFARRMSGLVKRGEASSLVQRQIPTVRGAVYLFAIEDVVVCAVTREGEVSPSIRERLSVVTKAIMYARKTGLQRLVS